MSLIDDHLPCPRLSRWVGDRLGGSDVGKLVLGAPPRRLLRFAEAWPDATGLERLRGLLVLSQLGHPLPCPAEVLRRLEPDATIVEVAAIPGAGLFGWARPIRRRAALRAAAVDRLAMWLEAGLCTPEQWASWDPVEALIMVGGWTAQADGPAANGV